MQDADNFEGAEPTPEEIVARKYDKFTSTIFAELHGYIAQGGDWMRIVAWVGATHSMAGDFAQDLGQLEEDVEAFLFCLFGMIDGLDDDGGDGRRHLAQTAFPFVSDASRTFHFGGGVHVRTLGGCFPWCGLVVGYVHGHSAKVSAVALGV